jgi:hypothetical protein
MGVIPRLLVKEITIKTFTMNELKNKYFAMKQQAVENMQHGNINAYLAKLVNLNDLRMQMIQMSGTRG